MICIICCKRRRKKRTRNRELWITGLWKTGLLQTGSTIIAKTLSYFKVPALWIKRLNCKNSFIFVVKVLYPFCLNPLDLWSSVNFFFVFFLFFVFPDKIPVKS